MDSLIAVVDYINISVVKEAQEINIVKDAVIIYHVKKINTIIDTCNDNVDVNIMMCIWYTE